MKCENCGNSHAGIYGSGRFCSSKCARGFSTKEKRLAISKKVSESLRGKHKHYEIPKDFVQVVKSSRSMREAAQKLSIPLTSFKRMAIEKGVYKTNQGWSRGIGIIARRTTKERFIREVLKENGLEWRNSAIKAKLLEFDMVKDACSICNQANIWNGKPLVLQLDHINGKSRDNRLENIRLVCPNCHSQTDTFGSKNRKKFEKVSDAAFKEALLNSPTVNMAIKKVGLSSCSKSYERARKLLNAH
jgi:sugar diacid utilization regulator